QSLYPWLPVRWLMRNRFDSLSKFGACDRPVFIAQGVNDSIIPFALGERLFAAVKAGVPKHFCRMEGVDHNDAFPPAFYAECRKSLNEIESTPYPQPPAPRCPFSP